MTRDNPQRHRAPPGLWFVTAAVVGSVTMALVCAFAPLSAQIAVLGAFVSILVGLFLGHLSQEHQREQRRNEIVERLAVPLTLAPDHELYGQYLDICRSLTGLARLGDPILRDIALLKLASVGQQLTSVAGGAVVFSSTETWRTVYEKLLRSPDIKEYRSVAWVRSGDYWQDQPGRQSMEVNFEAAHRGLLIERIFVLADELWPPGQSLPSPPILPWIEEQHSHGLWLVLTREADLASEPDLLGDFGIYGDRAVGVQELDERCRTLRFTLHCDPQAVRLAKDRWERLALYGISFRRLLDPPTTDS